MKAVVTLVAVVTGVVTRDVQDRVAPRALDRPHTLWCFRQPRLANQHDEDAENTEKRPEREGLGHVQVLVLRDRGADDGAKKGGNDDGLPAHGRIVDPAVAVREERPGRSAVATSS